MKTTTLCFLLKGDEVLLAMKKRGFGVGKWNGVGGKVLDGESVEASALREIEEEIGVKVAAKDLKQVGEIKFNFQDNPGWDNHCHVFIVEKWSGTPIESEEMRPQWYKKNALPFKEMWVDDPFWLPKILSGIKIEAQFVFTKDGARIVEQTVREVTQRPA